MTNPKSLKVLIDCNLDPEKDLEGDCLVLAVQRNPLRITLPPMIKKETCLPATKKKEDTAI